MGEPSVAIGRTPLPERTFNYHRSAHPRLGLSGAGGRIPGLRKRPTRLTPSRQGSNTGVAVPIDKGMDLRQLLIGRSLGRSLVRGLSMALVLLLGSWFVLVPVRAHGPSMTPTYGDGQLLLVNRLAYRFGEVRRGDVVAITLAGGKAVLVKRIIGLPGERIRIEEGQVIIDDQPLDEPYCTIGCHGTSSRPSSGPTRSSSSATTGRCWRSTTTSAAPTGTASSGV